MQEKYINVNNLKVSEKLHNFVNDELLKDTEISPDSFWDGFDKVVHELDNTLSFSRQSRNQQRNPSPNIRRSHFDTFEFMSSIQTDDRGAVWVTKNDLCAHVY